MARRPVVRPAGRRAHAAAVLGFAALAACSTPSASIGLVRTAWCGPAAPRQRSHGSSAADGRGAPVFGILRRPAACSRMHMGRRAKEAEEAAEEAEEAAEEDVEETEEVAPLQPGLFYAATTIRL